MQDSFPIVFCQIASSLSSVEEPRWHFQGGKLWKGVDGVAYWYTVHRENQYTISQAMHRRLPSELLQDGSSNTLQDRFPERCSSLQANGSQVFAESTLQKSRQQQALCKGKVCKRKKDGYVLQIEQSEADSG